MKIKKYENSIIYVLCPANIKTGGTELAHQLVHLLNKYDVEAYITYITDDHNVKIADSFRQYTTEYKVLSDINDKSENLLIIPEAWTFIESRFCKIRKAIWWMSVDNYLKHSSPAFAFKRYGFKQAIKTVIKILFHYKAQVSTKKLKKIEYHFVQSEYARLYLSNLGIESMWLTDYINEIYFETRFETLNKEDLILYNPSKGEKITQRIIREYHGCGKWIPLVNMTNQEMRETLQRAKVYIDFGPFPGKDRIPREAALSYCCLITGTLGASGNEIDMPIKEEYKFSNPMRDTEKIVEQINSCFVHYYEKIDDFSAIRDSILEEKDLFESQVREIFC